MEGETAVCVRTCVCEYLFVCVFVRMHVCVCYEVKDQDAGQNEVASMQGT